MKNIIKKLVLLTTVLFAAIAFSPKSKAANVDGWISNVSKIDSYYYQSTDFQDLTSKTYTQTYYGGFSAYVTEYWVWIGNNLIPGYPTTSYNSFSYSFDNFHYTRWNGDDFHFSSAATRLSLKNNTSSDKYVLITVNGTSIDGQGYSIGSFNGTVGVIVPAYQTVVSNPFPSNNYRYGTLSWEVVPLL